MKADITFWTGLYIRVPACEGEDAIACIREAEDRVGNKYLEDKEDGGGLTTPFFERNGAQFFFGREHEWATVRTPEDEHGVDYKNDGGFWEQKDGDPFSLIFDGTEEGEATLERVARLIIKIKEEQDSIPKE